MQVLNVIKTTTDNRDLDVNSYIIQQNCNSQFSDNELIKKAEEKFKAIIKENSADEPSDEDLENILDDGIYEGETFTVYLHWSYINQ